eukprot:TRINITY_DN64097_c1_g1_i1.p1 TRINITY_DN64097_c1_g1~~TRINITY_DN64097_c1_g1_i1.p1  ORF type:complete len:771 (+),score=65.83 TRINITY_DN64097_c1_g1_i1:67-2379(+)
MQPSVEYINECWQKYQRKDGRVDARQIVQLAGAQIARRRATGAYDTEELTRVAYAAAFLTHTERAFDNGRVAGSVEHFAWLMLALHPELPPAVSACMCYVVGSLSVLGSTWWRDDLETKSETLGNALRNCLEQLDLLQELADGNTVLVEILLDALASFLRVVSSQVPLCSCGHPLVCITCAQCYASASVYCNKCKSSWKDQEITYHCNNGKTPIHGQGYDLCPTCVSTEVGTLRRIDSSKREFSAWLEKKMLYRTIGRIFQQSTNQAILASCVLILGNHDKGKSQYTKQFAALANYNQKSGTVAIRTLFNSWYPNYKSATLSLDTFMDLQGEVVIPSKAERLLAMLAQPSVVSPAAYVWKLEQPMYITNCIAISSRPQQQAENPVRRVLYLASNQPPTPKQIMTFAGTLPEFRFPPQEHSKNKTNSPLNQQGTTESSTSSPNDDEEPEKTTTEIETITEQNEPTLASVEPHPSSSSSLEMGEEELISQIPGLPPDFINPSGHVIVVDDGVEDETLSRSSSSSSCSVKAPLAATKPSSFYYKMVHESNLLLRKCLKTEDSSLPDGSVFACGFVDLDDQGQLTPSNLHMQPASIKATLRTTACIFELFAVTADGKDFPMDLLPLVFSYLPAADAPGFQHTPNNAQKGKQLSSTSGTLGEQIVGPSFPEDKPEVVQQTTSEGSECTTAKYKPRCYHEAHLAVPVKVPYITTVILNGDDLSRDDVDCYYVGVVGTEKKSELQATLPVYSAVGLGMPVVIGDENLQQYRRLHHNQ